LAQAFGEYGTVVNVKLPAGPDGRPKGFAFVEFSTHKEAQAATDAFNG
jgi:RNA recognition motif-containing protein